MNSKKTNAARLVDAAYQLRAEVQKLTFAWPVTYVYNPLVYAMETHEAYLRTYGLGRKRVLFLGMNPGPFGMAQTGVPFGEIQAVRDWMKLNGPVAHPEKEHPKRPVLGFDCPRSEVSGRRLWGLFRQRFGTAGAFFREHFVANYCPLVFLESSGCNRTPDKLPVSELTPVRESCDAHLRTVVAILEPEWIIGVGRFAEERAGALFAKSEVRIGTVLHPSPASPASNRDWEGAATRKLQELGVWE